jgi:hypothetical protein
MARNRLDLRGNRAQKGTPVTPRNSLVDLESLRRQPHGKVHFFRRRGNEFWLQSFACRGIRGIR